VLWLPTAKARGFSGQPALDRVNEHQVYMLGSDLRPLRMLGSRSDKLSVGIALISARGALNGILRGASWPKVAIAREAAENLERLVNSLWHEEFADPGTGDLAQEKLARGEIDSSSLDQIRRALDRLEVLLNAELSRAATFVAPQRGIYDTEFLVNAAEKSIPSALAPLMPDKAFAELHGAGRCLAFGLYTAAGFHMCRAIESVLEEYYFEFSGSRKALRSWHDYYRELEELRKTADPAPEVSTLAYINQLRQSTRNPIMHPRVVLDETDAMTIFDLGRGVMLKMAQELRSVRAEKAAASGPRLVAAGGTL
jgi:hypothetical protein